MHSTNRNNGLALRIVAYVLVCALILILGDSEPGGMIRNGPSLLQEVPSGAWPLFAAVGLRLWPLIAIAAVQFVFILSCARLEVANGAVESRVALDSPQICAIIIGAALVLSLLAVWDLRAFPSSGDENSYLYGARTFLAGRLWNPAPENPQFFATFHILEIAGKLVSKYEPGWAAVLAAGHWVGLPFWAINPLLGALLLTIIVQIALRYEGGIAATIAVALIGLSPFYLFMTASYFNSILAAVLGASFIYFAFDYLERPRSVPALCAGVALGALGVVRTYDVLIFALTFVGAAVLRRDRRHFAYAPLIALGGCPFLAALLLYYDVIGGEPFVPLVKLYGPTLRLGLLPISDWGEAYVPGRTFAEAVEQFVNLAEWTSPVLLVLNVAAMVWRGRRKTLRLTDWLFTVNVLLYMLHATSGGDRYGPRYYFETYPYFVLTIAAAAADVFRQQLGMRYCRIAAGAILSHLTALGINLVMLLYFMRPIIDERMDLYDQVARNRLDNAVVIIRSSPGSADSLAPLDLTRNGIALSGPVIYALDPGPKLPALKSMFPNRKVFVYDRAQSAPSGTLTSLD